MLHHVEEASFGIAVAQPATGRLQHEHGAVAIAWLCSIAHFREELALAGQRSYRAIIRLLRQPHATMQKKPRGKLVKIIPTAADRPVMLSLRQTRGGDMNMSSESLLVVLFVGLVAGWLAGQFVQGTGLASSATLSSDCWVP